MYERAHTKMTEANEQATDSGALQRNARGQKRGARKSTFKTTKSNKNKWFDVALTSLSNFK